MSKIIKYTIIICVLIMLGFVVKIVWSNICLKNMGGGVYSPVIWNNLKISFPNEVAYYTGNQTDVIALIFIKDYKTRLDLMKIDIQKVTKESLLNEMKKRGYTIVSVTNRELWNYDCFEIIYIDNENIYKRDIVVKQQDLIIAFYGDQDKYYIFEEILNNIEFLDTKGN